MTRFKLLKRQRLSGVSTIRGVFKKGSTYNCRGARLIVLPNSLGYNRFLCTFRRGYGSAVLRNRIRRISKECFRLTNPKLKQGFDLVFLVFSEEIDCTLNAHPLLILFKTSGLLSGS